MRTVASGQSAQPGNVTPRVWIADSSDALVDRTTSGVIVEYDDPSADAPIGAATITFRRGEGASSLAPLMTVNPPIDLNRRVMVEVPVGGGVYKEVFRGAIDSVRWPERFGDLVIECRDQARNFADTRIETIRAYGSAAGVALETVAQSVADDNLAVSPTIYVPTATGAVIVTAEGAEPYKPSESVYESVKHLADSIGWAARYRYIDSLSDWRFTLFEPSRTKTVADHTFADTAYFDVSMMEQDIEDIRTIIAVEFTNPDGVRQTVQYPSEANAATDPAVLRYGRRYAKISEASDSPIDNEAKALKLATAAYNDLSEPDAILEVRCPYFWPGEVGVDLYTFTANNVHFSSDQTLAPVSIRHRIAVGERAESRIVCRGAPTGGVLTWRKRAQPPKNPLFHQDKPETKLLQNFRARDSADGLSEVITWTNGAKVQEVWKAVRTFTGPFTSDMWDVVADEVMPMSPLLSTSLTVEKPTETDGTPRVTLVQLEGRWQDPATGEWLVDETRGVQRRIIYPKTHIKSINPETGDLATGAVSLAKQFAADVPVAKFVADAASLPADNSDADYYIALDTRQAYQWDGSAWVVWDPATNTPDHAFLPALTAGVMRSAYIASLDIEVGDSIQSANYVAGTSGWRIDGDGNFEGNEGEFRGALTASTIDCHGRLSFDLGARAYFETPGMEWLTATAEASITSLGTDIRLTPHSGGYVDFQNMGALPTGKAATGNYLPIKVDGTVFYLALYS